MKYIVDERNLIPYEESKQNSNDIENFVKFATRLAEEEWDQGFADKLKNYYAVYKKIKKESTYN